MGNFFHHITEKGFMSQLPGAPGAPFAHTGKPGMLAGVRVVEFADELGEYCGLLLAGLGADVIKVEPPAGSATRKIGPYAGELPDPEKSLFFWAYNRGKQSAVLDMESPAGREAALSLIGAADVVLDTTRGRLIADLKLEQPLDALFPALIVARITPFGDSGPWKDFKSSDLIHLALGGASARR